MAADEPLSKAKGAVHRSHPTAYSHRTIDKAGRMEEALTGGDGKQKPHQLLATHPSVTAFHSAKEKQESSAGNGIDKRHPSFGTLFYLASNRTAMEHS